MLTDTVKCCEFNNFFSHFPMKIEFTNRNWQIKCFFIILFVSLLNSFRWRYKYFSLHWRRHFRNIKWHIKCVYCVIDWIFSHFLIIQISQTISGRKLFVQENSISCHRRYQNQQNAGNNDNEIVSNVILVAVRLLVEHFYWRFSCQKLIQSRLW